MRQDLREMRSQVEEMIEKKGHCEGDEPAEDADRMKKNKKEHKKSKKKKNKTGKKKKKQKKRKKNYKQDLNPQNDVSGIHSFKLITASMECSKLFCTLLNYIYYLRT